jgi:hypothetical protein
VRLDADEFWSKAIDIESGQGGQLGAFEIDRKEIERRVSVIFDR